MPDRRNAVAVLDKVFSFLPAPVRLAGRYLGLYEAILSGRARDSGDLYELMPRWMLRFQDANYSALARDLVQYVDLRRPIVQLGCGRGDLLRRLADLGAEDLIGIDRSEGMVNAAARRLRRVPRARVVRARVEELDIAAFAPIETVIINNFWGMLPPDSSRGLLERIREHLSESGVVVIGDCRSGQTPEHIRQALRESAHEIGFYLSYPPFMAFDECGYTSTTVSLGGGDYCLLTSGTRSTGRPDGRDD